MEELNLQIIILILNSWTEITCHGWTPIEKAQRIARNTRIYEIFTKYDWEWLEHAGANGNSLDSQHFSKPENSEFKKIDWNNSEKNSNEQDEPEFIKYNLTDEQLIQLASLCQQEQGSPKGAAAEASLMANILELHKYETTEGYSIDAYGLYNWVRNGGWFSEAALYMDEKKATNEVIEAVRSVLVDGKRVLPRYVNEHDCFGDIISVTNNGEAVDINDKSNYIKNVSIIANKHNSTYTFYDFPGTNDPFGTTLSIEDRQELGDECYDFDTGEMTGESNKSSQSSKNSTGNKNTTFYAKVATWSEVTNICETTYEKSSDKAEVEQDEIVNTNETNLRLTLTNVNYQDFISGYTMPFNYLWALLITSQNKDLVMDLADLVYNSEIEITIYDNLNVNTSVKVEQYTKKRDIETGILARTQFTDSQGQTHNIAYPLKNYNDSDEVKYTKTYTTITKTNTITQSLSKADVWIVNYTQNYNYMPTETTVTEGDVITKENQTFLPPETKMNQDIYRHLPGYENEIKQSTRESEEYQQAMAQARSDAAGTTEHDNENSEDNTQEIESINVSDFAITTIVDRLYNRITRSLINQQEQTTITNEVTKYVSVPAKMEKKDKKGGTIIAQNKTLDEIVRVLEDKRITKIKKEDIEKAFDEETNSKLKPLKFCQDGKILKIRCTGKGENKKYTLYKLENFVQILLDNYSAKKNLIDESAYGWLITILEINAEVDDVEMIDITKYLIYKATGKNLGIDENNVDFSVYDPANFKKTSTGTIGSGGASYSSINITPEELEILYKITAAERGGGTQQQQEYVVSVILNRVLLSRYPNNVKDVVYEPGAFACMTDGNYDSANPSEVTKAAVDNVIATGDKAHFATFFMTPHAFLKPDNQSWVRNLIYLFNDEDESLRNMDIEGVHNLYTTEADQAELQQYSQIGSFSPENASAGTIGTYVTSNGKNFNLYIQGGNAPWANNDYGDDRSMARAGCGPTALAIIASAYNRNISPENVRQTTLNLYGIGNHSSAEEMSNVWRSLGINVITSIGPKNDKQRIINCLKNGGQVWLIVTNCKYTSGSHCMALIDYDSSNDNVYVAHGSAGDRPYGWNSLDEVMSYMKDGRSVLYIGG